MGKGKTKTKRRRVKERPKRLRKAKAPEDGSAQMTVGIRPGIVAITYDRPLQRMLLPADDAMAMGSKLMKAAKEANDRALAQQAGMTPQAKPGPIEIVEGAAAARIAKAARQDGDS